MQFAVAVDNDGVHSGQAVDQLKPRRHTQHKHRGGQCVAVDGMCGQYACALYPCAERPVPGSRM